MLRSSSKGEIGLVSPFPSVELALQPAKPRVDETRVGGYALASLLRERRMLIYFPVTAIVAPGGWATVKRPFSDFVAARTLPSKRNTFLPICRQWAWCRRYARAGPPSA